MHMEAFVVAHSRDACYCNYDDALPVNHWGQCQPKESRAVSEGGCCDNYKEWE